MELYQHQIDAIKKLHNGNILDGGVGTGKSITSLAYYYLVECKGSLPLNGRGFYRKMKEPKDLYIITTARKRDTREWNFECAKFGISDNQEENESNIKLRIDSWNNIEKYSDINNSFFIFDEQRVVGYGAWSKSFIKIAKNNRWILLSATPGDTWMDYIPVFIANGFYKNKTDFIKKHVVFSRFSKYPKVEKYIRTDILEKLKNGITVHMEFERKTVHHKEYLKCDYDTQLYFKILKERWNPFEDKPIEDMGEVCRLLRTVVNSDESRIEKIKICYDDHKRIIVFYNFNFELLMLKYFCEQNKILYSEWNGHKHQPIPEGTNWIYLVQYTAGAEGWNCIKTDTIVFYSQNYSYKATVQAAGRIDRLNTPYKELYYYYLISDSSIDKAIKKSLSKKKDFNEKKFLYG